MERRIKLNNRESVLVDPLSGTIEVLIGSRKPTFRFEKALRLFLFQTWVYLPMVSWPDKGAIDLGDARANAAAKFLDLVEMLERKKVPKSDAGLGRLERLFKIPGYPDLFAQMKSEGSSWEKLLQIKTPEEFDKLLSDYIGRAEVVADLMDYRFRYAIHGGAGPKPDKSYGALSHAFVYRLCDKTKPPFSGKTIRNRWKEFKWKAVFIYVSEKMNRQFAPVPLSAKDFTNQLIKQANSTEMLKSYFGRCAYVTKMVSASPNELGQDEEELFANFFPPESVLPSIPLETDPLPLNEGVIAGLEDYDEKIAALKEN